MRNAQRAEPFDLAAARRSLLAWYRRSHRDLPWRRTHDPYRIWISEIMLQQTRVEAVRRYYETFLDRFPDVRSLARARLSEVLHSWSGLGYYTRARQMHAAARRIVEGHGGEVPRDPAALLALPGIGRYTAGAIQSIAFGQPAPILDGNVVRVLTRLGALAADVEAAATRRELWNLAERWASCRSPGDANQALMELGATVCIKPVPRCESCPIETRCRARRLGRERELPHPRRRAPESRVHLDCAVVRRGSKLLLVRRRSGRLLRDWWELPTCGGDARAPLPLFAAARPHEPRLATALRSRFDVRVRDPEPAGDVRHGILSHRIVAQVWIASALAGRNGKDAPPQTASRHRAPRKSRDPTPLANLDLEELEWRWVDAATCRTLPLSTLARKALRAVAARDPRCAAYLGGAQAT